MDGYREKQMKKIKSSLLPKTKFFGIDYSASQKARDKIWITECIYKNKKARILDIYPLREKSLRFSIEDCNQYLVELVLRSKGAVFGFDFSFSIPAQFIKEPTWKDWILSFSSRYQDPAGFRKELQKLSGGKELKRKTEIDSRVPFSSYNLWIYKQTYFGITQILYPLMKSKHVCFLPFDQNKLSKASLMETCPASFLKEISIEIDLSKSYKGKDKSHTNQRIELLKILNTWIPIHFTKEELIEKIIQDSEGDALDSLVCALSSIRGIESLDNGKLKNINLLEGYVF